MKRTWMVGAVLALAALAGPAQAQTEVGVQLFGGPAGARLVSEASISARVQGDLVVTFRGDAAAGCAAQGLCSYSGTIVVHPHDGQLGIVTYRRHGRIGHLVFVSLGSPENGYATSARVTRSVSGAPAGTCADAQSSLLSGQSSAPNHGGMVTLRLLAPAGSLLQTRCAGPLDGDLSSSSPVATIPLARLLRGRIVLDLSGRRTFASHGFAGTIDSTVTMKLGKPRKQSGNASFPPGIKTHRVRTVIEQLSLVRVRGGLTATAQGTSNPIVCGLLDSCGLERIPQPGRRRARCFGSGDRERAGEPAVRRLPRGARLEPEWPRARNRRIRVGRLGGTRSGQHEPGRQRLHGHGSDRRGRGAARPGKRLRRLHQLVANALPRTIARQRTAVAGGVARSRGVGAASVHDRGRREGDVLGRRIRDRRARAPVACPAPRADHPAGDRAADGLRSRRVPRTYPWSVVAPANTLAFEAPPAALRFVLGSSRSSATHRILRPRAASPGGTSRCDRTYGGDHKP